MKKCFLTEKGPRAIGPYSTATIHNGVCYLSGMLGVDPSIGKLKEGGVEAQTRQAFENIKAVLAEAGLTMDAVVKTTVFLQDMNDFAAMNGVYASYFTEGSYPARSAVQVAKLPKGGLVEIESIACTE